MTEFKKYPSIEQYRNIVKQVKMHCKHNQIPLPTLEFTGTVKLHGTNAAIVFNPKTGEVGAQSRNSFITPENDNAGFAAWVKSNEYSLKKVFGKFNIKENAYIYGEWCGGNIQKGVGINGLDKMFVVFNASVDENWFGASDLALICDLCMHSYSIYSIYDFPSFTQRINFNEPELASNTLAEITSNVENECPVAKSFGVDNGVGEGVVWTAKLDDKILKFKVKGEKHSVSKVKTLAPVDVEKVKSINEFIDKVITENRLKQGLQEVFGDEEPDIKQTGVFLKWVGGDVFKEELDTLEESGLTRKEVGGKIAERARQWFMGHLNDLQ